MSAIIYLTSGIAVLVHVAIFVFESLLWERPATRKVFGLSESEASATALFAYNQGFYNLFLALIVATGIVLRSGSNLSAGNALIIAGTAAMAGAATVLATRSPDKLSAALGQGLMPAIAAISTLLAL